MNENILVYPINYKSRKDVIKINLCKFYSKEYSENLTHSLINRLIPILSEFGK